MNQGTIYTEATLLESMKQLTYSMKKLEILLKGKPVGYYESDVERMRKWSTLKSTKHIAY